MQRLALCVVLGLLAGAAPPAPADDQELAERLRALQEALHKAMHRAPAVGNLPAVDVRGLELAILPMADLAMGIADHIRPSHTFLDEDKEWPIFGGQAEEAPQTFGTVEEIMELVRSSVWPEAWESGSILVSGTQMLVHQTPAVVRDVRRFLDQNLRTRAHRSVTVEAEVVEVSHALYRTLTAGRESALLPGQRQALEQALAAQAAKRVFAGRVTGLLGQRVLLWHGRQVAVLADTDVEVAEGAKTADPIIQTVQSGAYIWVRPTAGGDDGRLRLDVEVRVDELKAIEKRETRENGILDMPVMERLGAGAAVHVPARTWAVVGSGVTEGEKVRLVLVRGTLLPRGGKR